MLFQSSLRKELARNFGTTLVVLTTIIMTMTLTQTLGQASRGVFKPSDIFIIMGYTVLSDLPTLLALCLFISVVATLMRMHADSEMVIWHASGLSLLSLLKPIIRFAWPIVAIIFVLALVVLPWAYGSIDTLQMRYANRGEINRIEPGQFRASADRNSVFYVDAAAPGETVVKNVFAKINANNRQILLTAKKGTLVSKNKQLYLQLYNGQEVQRNLQTNTYDVANFDSYSILIPGIHTSGETFAKKTGALTSLTLLAHINPTNMAELAWRLGQGLIAINFVFIGVAVSRFNPRLGKIGGLGVAFLAFALYFNLTLVGKSWVEKGSIFFFTYLIVLHGLAFLLAMLWILKRNFSLTFRSVWNMVRP